jgi:hypothetical protein
MQFPALSGDWRIDGPVLMRALNDYLLALEKKNALTIGQAQIYVDQGLQFPSTQVVSSDRHNLDDYTEGDGSALEWTPVLTFATPGDLAVTYSTRVGTFTKIGRVVIATFRLNTTAFTYTTASGVLEITGLPYTAANVANAIWGGWLVFGGVTKAGYTEFDANVSANASLISVVGSGSGVAPSNVTAADMPSGGSVILRGAVIYHAAT